MRADGKRIKNLPPILMAIPYIMPKRYDAQNTVTLQLDEDAIRDYIRAKRREGRRIDHMAFIIAAYYKAALLNPKLNYFIMNKKIYERNHFCVSFVIGKKLPNGDPDQTTVKVFLEPEDTVFTIYEKLTAVVEANSKTEAKNNTDKFARMLFLVPGLATFVIWLAYNLDKFGLLPRFIIDLSPFHTSLFITNLASIKTPHIHHHCYEFGTTSVFVSMGAPVPDYEHGNYEKKMMPIGVVTDERIASGYDYSKFATDFRRFLKNPELLELPGIQ